MDADWTPLDAYDVERSIRPRGGGGGHLISGSFYIIFGLGLLILSVHRARHHALNESFPEQDMSTLRRISVAVCIAGILGILIHGLYGGVYVKYRNVSLFMLECSCDTHILNNAFLPQFVHELCS